MIGKGGMSAHAKKHRRLFCRLTGRGKNGSAFLKYEYVVALLNPLKVKPALADWVACAEGQNRITKYIEK